jgi:secreted trypsin-like serine protease
MKKYCLLAITILLCISEYSFAQITPKIIGGSNGNISQVPYQVLINLNGTDGCGGVIIAPDWIVTCGHCVFNPQTGTLYPFNEFTIYAGITDRTNKSSGQSRAIDAIIMAPGFNYNNATDDIALIHLSNPLTFNSNVQEISIATQNDVNAGFLNPGVTAQVSGWGFTQPGGNQATILQILNETIVDINTLNPNLYPYPITPGKIAAGGVNGQGACNGDSGGPLTVPGTGNTRILAGLVDFRPIAGCASGHPDIYVRIPDYTDFIVGNTAEIAGTQPCCANFSTTYTLNTVIPVTNVSWNTTDFSPSSGTGTNATITSTYSYPNSGTINYNYTTPQGNVATTLTISNGQAIYASLSNNGQNQLGTVNSVSPGQHSVFVYAPSATSFSWSLLSGGLSWAPNGNGSSMTFNINSGQSGTFAVTANNRCNPYRNITFTTGFGGYGFNILQDINKGEIIIKVIPPQITPSPNTYHFNIQLNTMNKTTLVQKLDNANTAVLDVKGLAKGEYLLVISKGKDKVTVPIKLKM